MQPLPDAGSSLSPALPSFLLLNAGSRGFGLNPGFLLRSCETGNTLSLTFLICEMGMMTGPAHRLDLRSSGKDPPGDSA